MLTSLATKVCEIPGWLLDPTVCPGFVSEMSKPMLEIMERDILTKLRVCDEFLGFCSSPTVDTLEIEDFNARVLADKPAETLDNEYVNNLYKQIHADPNERKSLTFLHMSDVHLDTEYAVGSNNDCGSYLCCRAEYGFPEDPELQAGQWGSYLCDLPL